MHSSIHVYIICTEETERGHDSLGSAADHQAESICIPSFHFKFSSFALSQDIRWCGFLGSLPSRMPLTLITKGSESLLVLPVLLLDM